MASTGVSNIQSKLLAQHILRACCCQSFLATNTSQLCSLYSPFRSVIVLQSVRDDITLLSELWSDPWLHPDVLLLCRLLSLFGVYCCSSHGPSYFGLALWATSGRGFRGVISLCCLPPSTGNTPYTHSLPSQHPSFLSSFFGSFTLVSAAVAFLQGHWLLTEIVNSPKGKCCFPE